MNKVNSSLLLKLSRFFVESNIPFSGKTLCVCLSGGADSVALLRGVLLLRDDFGYSVVAAHFNHMIRGDESDRDECFCKDLCVNLGVKLYCGRDDVPAFSEKNSLSLEDAARKSRYSFFDRILSKDHVDYCLTAHNMNDDAETVLMNLIRGSGSNGASSILPIGNNILRPLLEVDRSEIECFLTELKQPHITDSTNEDVNFTRNYIRNTVLPLIKAINPSVVKSLHRYAEAAREDRSYFDAVTAEAVLNNTDLRSLPPAIRKRMYIAKYRQFCGMSLNYEHIDTIDSHISTANRKVIKLNDCVDAIIDNGNVSFTESVTTNHAPAPQKLAEGENTLFNGEVTVFYKNCESQDLKTINKIYISTILSVDRIVGDIYVRTRQIGDKIVQNGMHKSVKKLLIDKKIPREFRDLIPIFYDEEGIIFIPYIGTSDRVSAKNSENLHCILTIFNSIKPERWNYAYEK